ncbi:N-acetylglucosaminyldiphosphoundecaprenol N-acetyl-beta-D-mannosaminyltransferase [Aequitasia blattaphilus]|uniref:WecB/TagA/CpsF family glycosyltransferase n=1 Tax=Aequitasia blattaphilus TaxID=2949332 RepID=A0ABT1EAC1_9FIRM|nr:WecB/TagA/CpsF family glycosyltransferase [Aequitasia blattaphilus]MCP1102626.1 WecB/TagA/CpsF family glycosyltransferase [Aequitasia blattaphilus]MCR8615266.1 WecB/TagA/CpsF family glycosyltransferase [Aequitasia blattaphilus]
MIETIDILDINISRISSKEAMKLVIRFCGSEALSVVEVMNLDTAMQLDGNEELIRSMEDFDLILPGDDHILEAANITEKKLLEEARGKTFTKLLLKYLNREKSRIFLLTNSEEEGKEFYHLLNSRYENIQLVGMAKVSEENRSDDMLVNAINGGEVECVLSILSTPLQEDFILKNRNLLNARIWLGIGKDYTISSKERLISEKLTQFLKKKILKIRIQQRKNML